MGYEENVEIQRKPGGARVLSREVGMVSSIIGRTAGLHLNVRQQVISFHKGWNTRSVLLICF